MSVYAELLDGSSTVVGTSDTLSITLNKPTFIGFLDPIHNDGSSILNRTKSIPVKFQVQCDGGFVNDLTARLELEKSGRFNRPIVTRIEPASKFWRAEDYHQSYLQKRGQSHCAV